VIGPLPCLLAAALGLLLAVLACALALPVTVVLEAGTDPPHWRMTVRLARWRNPLLTLPGGRGGSGAPPAGPPRPQETQGRPARRGRSALRVDPVRLVRAMPALVGALLPRVRIARLEVSGRFGLEDPAETGRVWGQTVGVAQALSGSDRIRLSVVPEFAGPVLEGRLSAAFRLRPLMLIGPLLRFFWAVFGPRRRPLRGPGFGARGAA
jgi:hypothetical protein